MVSITIHVKYKIIDIFQEKQIYMINDILSGENLQNMENEVQKLSLFLYGKNSISDDEIHIILNLSRKNKINDLIESAILGEKNRSFTILSNLTIDDEIYIIRCFYNYFLKLQKIFLLSKLHKSKDNISQFVMRSGVFFGRITREILRKKFNLKRINEILKSISDHEIRIKMGKNYEVDRLLLFPDV